MFYEEIRSKRGISYISICSFSILYNSKSVLMATSLGTNAVVLARVHCILQQPTCNPIFMSVKRSYHIYPKYLDTLTSYHTYLNPSAEHDMPCLSKLWIQISWLLKKPTDLDLHCLSLNM